MHDSARRTLVHIHRLRNQAAVNAEWRKKHKSPELEYDLNRDLRILHIRSRFDYSCHPGTGF